MKLAKPLLLRHGMLLLQAWCLGALAAAALPLRPPIRHRLPACHVLQHVKGRIFNDPSLPGLPPAQRAAVYQVGQRCCCEI